MKSQKGFSLVELLVVVIIIAIIAAIAIPSLLASRRAANEASAVQSMRTYHSAQSTFQALDPARNYAVNAPALLTAGLVDSLLGTAAAVKSGYTLALSGAVASGSTPSIYCAGAVPQNATSGTNNYAVSGANGGVVVVGGATLLCTAGAIAGGPGTPVQ